MSLGSLPPLLAGDEGVIRLAGSSTALLAVPEAARAFVIAGLVRLSTRRPFLVATATTTDAERLAHDLQAFLGEGEGRAGSSCSRRGRRCPFERVSPSVETMGRRLRVLWRLGNPRSRPRAAARCHRRPGPGAAPAPRPRRGRQAEPVYPSAATRSTRRAGGAAGRRRLPARVPGRAPRRGGGAGVDRRRLPLDRRRAGADRPVGRRGRPADRVLGRPTSARPTTSTRSRSSAAGRSCPARRCASGRPS